MKSAVKITTAIASFRLARQGYYGMVSEVDHHVGRMLDALDELGIAEETIVVFTSDHGEWLGEHLRYGKSYPGHDCVSRVPLLMRVPGKESGRRVSNIVEGVDVLPTLLEACGVPHPIPFTGSIAISRFLRGKHPGQSSRTNGSHGLENNPICRLSLYRA